MGWIASNLLYVGVMDGLLNKKAPLGVAEPHYFFCSDAQAQEKAMAVGSGFKGGSLTLQGGLTFTATNPACKAFGKSSNMGGYFALEKGLSASYLRVPVKSAQELENNKN